MGSKTIDISKLRETGKAMHQPAQQIQQILQGMAPQDITNRQDIVTELTIPVQDALSVLKIGAQYGVPGIPASFKTTAPQSTPTR
jgi:predicted dinucleotide-binding enzyme